MKEIYTLRHGITTLNKENKLNGQIDEPLAPEGFEQVKNATSRVPSTVRHIYSSPMLRARQTAEIISSELKIPVSVHKEITEISMGSLEGRTWEDFENGEELKSTYRNARFNFHYLGGESAEDVINRLKPFFNEVELNYKGNEGLIITHGGVIRVIHFLERGEVFQEKEGNLSLRVFNLDKILKKTK
jgi:broad specificity phosphatase PhoE